ncbi:MAG: hypothetical protein HZC44_11130 [Geobacter sp.]|nr:hypothetical protein [Geobacter sp.]
MIMNVAAQLWTALRVIVVIAGASVRQHDRPGIAGDPAALTAGDFRLITPAELGLVLAHPHAFLDREHRVSLTIADCPLLLAPLLLFYLKRHGFSRCRVWREPAGMTFSAAM